MTSTKLTRLPRRRFLARAATAVAAPAFVPGVAAAAEKSGTALERGHMRVAGFANAEMDFQLIRQMGTARYGGASVGECLALAQRIKDADPASWVREFSATAEQQQDDAQARARRGHGISASDQYLVACNSWRAAEYYSAINDPAHRRLGLQSRASFAAAMRARGVDFEVVNLPWGDTPLPAYWFSAPPGRRAKVGKTLMLISGYDGTLEETWIAYGRAALERGYHLLLLAGPGQMDTLRFYPAMAFIPEYERVAKVALDHVLARPGVDARRVALMGISYGGYFATRMAAHEPRIRALIANSPIVDLHAYMVSFVGFDPADAPDEQDIRLADIDHIPPQAMPAQTREMLRNLMLRMGEPGFKATYRRLRDYRVSDEQLARIRCPALALVGEGEGQEPLAQHRHFLQAVTGPTASHVFTMREGAEGHCQTANLGYSAAVSMDWLDEVFAS